MLRKAREFPGRNGMDLAKEVSTTEQYSWTQGSWTLDGGLPAPTTDLPYYVVAYDYGVKRNIMRILVDRGSCLTVVPAYPPAETVLASGAKTVKMKCGRHGGNHPVKDLGADRVMITAKNHGFAVDEKTLSATLRVTHTSLFYGTLHGLHRTNKPAFSFQGHPEARAPASTSLCRSLTIYRAHQRLSLTA